MITSTISTDDSESYVNDTNETIASNIPTDVDSTVQIDEQQQQQQDSTTTSIVPVSNPIIPDKVKIHFVAVGGAPILKRTKFQINADQRFAAVHVFLRKLLKLSSATDNNTSTDASTGNSSAANATKPITAQNLFLYCCSAFVPSPDHLVGELRDSFANTHNNTKELVIHYSIQEAWG